MEEKNEKAEDLKTAEVIKREAKIQVNEEDMYQVGVQYEGYFTIHADGKAEFTRKQKRKYTNGLQTIKDLPDITVQHNSRLFKVTFTMKKETTTYDSFLLFLSKLTRTLDSLKLLPIKK